jgi:hypothetical protein
LQGDYSIEEIGGKDGVFYDFMGGSIGPSFVVSASITVRGRGVCNAVVASNAAIVDMPNMDFIGNIQAFDTSSVALRNSLAAVRVTTGNTAKININKLSYVSTATNNRISGSGGTINVKEIDIQRNSSTSTAICTLSGTINLRIGRGRISNLSTASGIVTTLSGIRAEGAWSGSLFLSDLSINLPNSVTDKRSIGIEYASGITGKTTLKNCTIVTSGGGTQTPKSINAADAQDVIIQGSLNQTHAEDSDITFVGGSAITNTNFEA